LRDLPRVVGLWKRKDGSAPLVVPAFFVSPEAFGLKDLVEVELENP